MNYRYYSELTLDLSPRGCWPPVNSMYIMMAHDQMSMDLVYGCLRMTSGAMYSRVPQWWYGLKLLASI
jgi:hypothetical protein